MKNINENHNLYIIRTFGMQGSLIKIGYSSNITKRLLQYYHHNPLVELVGTYYKEDAKEFEKHLHSVLKAYRLREWYTEDKLEAIIKYIKGEEELPDKVKITEIDKLKMSIKPRFYKLCEKYEKMSEGDKKNIDLVEPMIKEAYEVLGEKKLKALEFRKSEIKKELINVNLNKSVDWKICKHLNLVIGKIYDKKELKEKLQSAYDKLGIKAKAKATDLKKWYYIEDKDVRNKNTGSIETKAVIYYCFIKLK